MPNRSPTPDRSSLSRHLPRAASPNALQASTPRIQRRMNQSLSYAQPSFSQSPLEPEVNVQPATPSLRERDQSSKFTNLARGLAREIEEEADAVLRGSPQHEATPRAYHHSTYASRPKRQARSPFQEKASERPERSGHLATPFRQRVHLPDVTGLTSAIASPSKIDVEFYGYDPKETSEHEGTCYIFSNSYGLLTCSESSPDSHSERRSEQAFTPGGREQRFPTARTRAGTRARGVQERGRARAYSDPGARAERLAC